jgi:hypothetical protein
MNDVKDQFNSDRMADEYYKVFIITKIILLNK